MRRCSPTQIASVRQIAGESPVWAGSAPTGSRPTQTIDNIETARTARRRRGRAVLVRQPRAAAERPRLPLARSAARPSRPDASRVTPGRECPDHAEPRRLRCGGRGARSRRPRPALPRRASSRPARVPARCGATRSGRLTYEPDAPPAVERHGLRSRIADEGHRDDEPRDAARRRRRALGLADRVAARFAALVGQRSRARDRARSAGALRGTDRVAAVLSATPADARTIEAGIGQPARSSTRRWTQSIYSDLGFMLLGFLVEDAGAAPLDAQLLDAHRRTHGDPLPSAAAWQTADRANRDGCLAGTAARRRGARRERMDARRRRRATPACSARRRRVGAFARLVLATLGAPDAPRIAARRSPAS